MTTLADLGHFYVRSLASGECATGKLRFANPEEAMLALELSSLRADQEPWRRECFTYPCQKCAGWHQTSRAQR